MGRHIYKGASTASVPETMDGLHVQNRAYRSLCASLEAQMAILTEKGREYQEAVTTLDSERAANAILTDEIAALRERVAACEAVLVQARDGQDIYLRARINSALAILAKQEAGHEVHR